VDKKLVRVGNSVAVVLDKSLRQALGIKPTTLVRVLTDGQRIIIEPTGERTVEAKQTVAITERMRALQIAYRMLRNDSMGNEQCAQLTCAWAVRRPMLSVLSYIGWLERVDWDTLSVAELRVIRRFEIASTALQADASWPEAIAAAVAAEPFDASDPDEQSVGVAKTKPADMPRAAVATNR
jgi:antitoxin component of MazEF toxin-antitoxin module